MRDIEAAYRDALVEEYESYVRAGRTADAEQVAQVLKDRYDHDVSPQGGKKAEPEAKAEAAPERADVEKPSENTAEPAPRRGGRQKLPRDDKGNIVREKAGE